ncbi:MAG: hypothetical protein IKL80_02845 [Clostridia bacterium]|nr:hypothetical protein [Clostridia bacterium]
MSEQINVFEIIKLFLRNWWKIALSAILAAIIFLLVSVYYLEPVYTSRGSLYVNNSTTSTSQNIDLSGLATSQQLALTFVELFSSDSFMAQVLDYSQLPYTAKQIKGMLSFASLNETEIIEVKAVSYYPEHAQTIVDAVLQNAQDEIMRVIGGGSITVVDEATFPIEPSSPSIPKNTVVGFMLGALLAMGLIFLIDVLDTRIKTEEDLRKVRGLPLLGLIPNIQSADVEEKKNGNVK